MRVCRFLFHRLHNDTIMNKTEIYILIAVFTLLTIILVWFGAKNLLDMRQRKQRQQERRKEHLKKKR